MDPMQTIYDYIDAHAGEYVRDLQTLVRQPSVSAQNIGLRECAELVLQMMHRDGLDAHLHELDGGPPVITGHITRTLKKSVQSTIEAQISPNQLVE